MHRFPRLFTEHKQNGATDEGIRKIKDQIHTTWMQGKNITFIWIPSHCGIVENEQADEAVKEAIIQQKLILPALAEDFIAIIKHKIKQNSAYTWNITTINKLRIIKDNIENSGNEYQTTE